MEIKSHRDIKVLQYIAIGLGIIGFIILFYFILLLTTQRILDCDVIKLDKYSQFGDFVGGLIGSIWALAGVLLFYVALVYQRRELEETIKSRDDQTLVLNKQIEVANFQQFLISFQAISEKFDKAVEVLQTEVFCKPYLDFNESDFLAEEPDITGFEAISNKFGFFIKEYPNLFTDDLIYTGDISGYIIDSFKDPILKLYFISLGEKFRLMLKLIENRLEVFPEDQVTKLLLQNLLRERTNEQYLALIFYSIYGKSSFVTLKYLSKRIGNFNLAKELGNDNEPLEMFLISMLRKYS